MAEKTRKEPVTEPESVKANGPDELVEIMLFKDGGKYKDDVFVCVNGQNCVIKRGVPVKIKRKFAEVLQQSMAQDAATASLIEAESGKFRQMMQSI